ncbi:hypothetical protein [Porphyromonas loveana]|uniref:hypothetical protein n=1 Tax=Porphyromonas loveana TaxID=1884669 RepID=UPI0035A0664E
MKKTILFLVLFVVSLGYATAQQRTDIPPKPTDETYEYIPFPTGEAIWSNRRYDNQWTPQEPKNTFSTIFMKGDTIWHDYKTYRKLYLCKGDTPDYSPENFWGGLREEDKKIYFRLAETYQGPHHVIPMFCDFYDPIVYHPVSYEEFVYCDFNIQENPEEYYKEFFSQNPFSKMGEFIKYLGTDYEWIGEHWRRVFYFDAVCLDFRWIEGIGCDRGFGFNGAPYYTGNYMIWDLNLLCFFQDGAQLYHCTEFEVPFAGSENCFPADFFPFSLDAVIADESIPMQYVNGSLIWDNAVFSHILLYDMQARLVFSAPTVGVHSVSLPATIPAGTYLYCGDDTYGRRYTGKVVIP